MAIKYSILGLLHYKDMHGYRIKEHIERNFGYMWSVNYGQIYQSLKKMEDEGLVRMTGVAPSDNGGPRKRLYSITGKGRREFSEWLSGSPEREMLLRDPFLTRFVFFDFGDDDRAIEMIDEQIEAYRRQLERREENVDRWRKHGVYVRLVAELGVQLNSMYLEWLMRARDEISREKDTGTVVRAPSS